MLAAANKSALVCALCACANETQKREARRFLRGLSTDELQYIAEFLGAWILEDRALRQCAREQLADAIEQFESARRRHHFAVSRHPAPGQEHKMILVLEYLCRSGLTQLAFKVGAGQA